ncbi:hypothetical protein QYF61_016173 [Mycteria americana]|uniref:Transmembrane protein 221 n=1 Tax=Mycteria americana TaxID=33587 RepID=A0AAN7MKY6_MYCAM|nr:hypothetical protein QYF61_016173 [Mycteria americana]
MVRHAAIGLFCCGVSVYLTGKCSFPTSTAQPSRDHAFSAQTIHPALVAECLRAAEFLLQHRVSCIALVFLVPQDVLRSPFLPALAIYMLLLFELEAGIASACILSSGIIVLLITVTHALVRASQVSRRSRSEVSHTLYENDSAQHGESSTSDLNNKNVAAPRPRPEIHREFSFPPFLERKSQLGSPASSNLTSSGSPGLRSEKESYNLPRTHRTLSAESGLLQAQGKPWNGVTQEMRNVLSRKPGALGKDSTLV